ncbi:MAG: hypothetical protein WDN06_06255 [Asticcacaulis sp.]
MPPVAINNELVDIDRRQDDVGNVANLVTAVQPRRHEQRRNLADQQAEFLRRQLS